MLLVGRQEEQPACKKISVHGWCRWSAYGSDDSLPAHDLFASLKFIMVPAELTQVVL